MDKDGLQSGSGRQSIELIYGHDLAVSQWVAEQLGCTGFGDCLSIGICRDGALIGGVVYNNARTNSDGLVYTLEMSIATVDKSWCNRRILRALFDLPFNVLQCRRITVLVDAGNEQVRRFDERLGFIHEGTLKEGHPDDDCAIYRMLRDECKWI